MNLKILQVGEPVLRQKARELSVTEIFSDEIQQLIVAMTETMRNAPGVGLAAPQIGESIQLAVIEDRSEYMHAYYSENELSARERVPVTHHVIINPKIFLEDEKRIEFHEGCLSLHGLLGMVPRAYQVRVECLNEKAEPITIKARGWYARILQHEIGHLNGELCIDHMKLETLTTFENFNNYWRK